MLHKSFDILETKADAERGTFEATVAVFGNVDKGGDRILPGAFKNTLAKWAKSGDPIPVILSHQWNDPMAHIGVVTDATETVKGLRVRGKLDVEDNPVAKQVHRLMTRRSLKEFSFGYSVPAGGQKKAKDGANDLLEVEIAEVGPTLKGMNPATELHAVKSMSAEEMAEEMSKLAVPPAEDLRKEAERVERELNDDRLPTDLPDPQPKAIGGGTRGAIGNLVRYYASKPHPFTECVRDNTKRFGKDRAERICATLKRMGGRKADEPEADFEQELYDAAGGDVEALLEMWHDDMAASDLKMDDVLAANLPQEVKDRVLDEQKAADMEAAPRTRSVDSLRKQADALALEVASGGVSLQKPPRHEPEPVPDLMPVKELKERMREAMLYVLTDGTEQK